METILAQLAVNIPVGVALLIMAGMFLRYLREERKEWRETILSALQNNTAAMREQAASLQGQGAALERLLATFQDHDDMARAAIAKLLARGGPEP